VPPTSRTHRGAPAQDRRIAFDAANGDSTEGHPGAEGEVDVRAIVLNAGRTWRAGDKGQSTGTIRQDACDIIPNGEWSSHNLGTGPPFELQSDAVVLKEEHGSGQRARIREVAVLNEPDANAVVRSSDGDGTVEQLESRVESNNARYKVVVDGEHAALRGGKAHGSLIFRVVCENRDRASYRGLEGSPGA
jgi:hypothetical protein